MTTYAEKLLPHDVEAEEAVLGSILIDGECLTRLVPLLKEGAFYRERNQLCFDAALSLACTFDYKYTNIAVHVYASTGYVKGSGRHLGVEISRTTCR